MARNKDVSTALRSKIGLKIPVVVVSGVACFILLAFFSSMILQGIIIATAPPPALNFNVVILTPGDESTIKVVNSEVTTEQTYTLKEGQLNKQLVLTVPQVDNGTGNYTYQWEIDRTNETKITGVGTTIVQIYNVSGNAATTVQTYNTLQNTAPGPRTVKLTVSDIGSRPNTSKSVQFKIIVPCSTKCKAGDVNCDGVFNGVDTVAINIADLSRFSCADVNGNGIYADASDTMLVNQAVLGKNFDFWPYAMSTTTPNGIFKYFPNIKDLQFGNAAIQSTEIGIGDSSGNGYQIGVVKYNPVKDNQTTSILLSASLGYETLYATTSNLINQPNVTIGDYLTFNRNIPININNNFECIIYKNQPLIINSEVTNISGTKLVQKTLMWLTNQQNNRSTYVTLVSGWFLINPANTQYVPSWSYDLLNSYLNLYPNILTGNANCQPVATVQ